MLFDMEEADEQSIRKEDGGGGRQISKLFPELKTYCLELLELHQNPRKHSSTVPAMLDLLSKSSPESLQPFFDYTLFPLLLLFDAAVNGRSQNEIEEQVIQSAVPKACHKVGDAVAEGVLQCLEELLKKCNFLSLDQMVLVLKKLTYGALLSPSEASEEFREGVIRCFRAVFSNLHPCSNNSCSCRLISGSPALKESNFRTQHGIHPEQLDSKECLLAFLQTPSASAAVGHWLSLLLKAADTEAALGHRGGSNLRIEAFLTIRVLVAKVGTADALAFFLPGVVSQFSKVLQASRTMMSGAAASTEALNQAIRGLAEYLMIVLEDVSNMSSLDESEGVDSDTQSEKYTRTQYFLEELRHLSHKAQDGSKLLQDGSFGEELKTIMPRTGVEVNQNNHGMGVGSFLVNRTREWIGETSAHVYKLLGATFPHISVHPANKVREGLLAAICGFLARCSCTLKECRKILLECLCVLAIDDSEEVSASAQEFLDYLLTSSQRLQLELDFVDILTRLVEKLPNAVLGSDETFAVSQAQQLLVVIYYGGPRLVMDHFLRSPAAAARFLEMFAMCMSQNSVFSGSLDKLIAARPSSVGYLHSVAELGAQSNAISDALTTMNSIPLEVPEIRRIQEKDTQVQQRNTLKNYKIPRMPPWFAYIGSQKLYQALAGILRLVGLSLIADSRNEGNLSAIMDIPLGYLLKLVSEIRAKEYNAESWNTWGNRIGSGQLVRQASTAVCILNEMIFGLSSCSVDNFKGMFRKPRSYKVQQFDKGSPEGPFLQQESVAAWSILWEDEEKNQLVDCVGRILHEYLSPEVWDLPVDHKYALRDPNGEAEDICFHFLKDTAMLHQVIIDGIGIFGLCLGRDFGSSGFLHSSLYLLLENLISSNAEVRSASDYVLFVLSAISGHSTVGHLVLANADYLIDSVCRQLRHLDLNPHVPSVLAALLSYIGIADEILPLLEEPLRSLSLELEILGRYRHPDLDVPFLKAVAEISKISKNESLSLPSKAESYLKYVKSVISDEEKREGNVCEEDSISSDDDERVLSVTESDWENVLFKLSQARRYRRMVGSIAGSCIIAATPLLASMKQAACLLALDIVEDGIVALAKVEEAYRHEKDTREAIEEMLQSYAFYHLQDALGAADEGTDENRLLPALNKLWPFFVACIRNKNPVAIRKCFGVIGEAVQLGGGDFFSRRFHTDGPHFWKLLATSPFMRKPNFKEERKPLQLPYRSSSTSLEDSSAEVSDQKAQAALLCMIADLSQNKRTASALDVVLKKVSGLVVGVACSGVAGLRDASLSALRGLASIDPDLIWLLVADVYYSMNKNMPSPPTAELPDMSQVLPAPRSSKDYLYVQYGGQTYGFDVDFTSVETAFSKLHSQVFIDQMV